MPDKDYYQILRVLPSATLAEIKKSYRLLAMEFHPDKNPSNQAAAQFSLIKEAYIILSNTRERKKYDAIRFSNQQTITPIATQPQEVKEMCAELVQQIKKVNPDRINKDKLSFDLHEILSEPHILLLQQSRNPQLIFSILEDIFYCLSHLDIKDCMEHIRVIKTIDESDLIYQNKINRFVASYRISYYWHKLKIIAALLIAIIFCWVMYKIK